MKKGGQGGFLFSTSPSSPPLPDKASPSPLPFLPLLADRQNPPGPLYKRGKYLDFTKGGDSLAFTKGGDSRDFTKGRNILAFCKGGGYSGLWERGRYLGYV